MPAAAPPPLPASLPPPSAGADWQTIAAAEIAARLALNPTEAIALVQLAAQHGRDLGYLQDLLHYVTTDPRIRLPGRVFARLVHTDQARHPVPAGRPRPPAGTPAARP